MMPVWKKLRGVAHALPKRLRACWSTSRVSRSSEAACNVAPRASTAQNSDRLSINSFFDHMHDTSHQDGVSTTD